jgi:hypothetical protein
MIIRYAADCLLCLRLSFSLVMVCVCRGSLFLDFGCHREYTSCVNLLSPGCVSKSALVLCSFLICYTPAAPTAGVQFTFSDP